MLVNGTRYQNQTSSDAIRILEAARTNRQRLCLRFGDPITGRDSERIGSQTCGYISRSTGILQVPLLVTYASSRGGDAFRDHEVIRITTSRAPRQVLYQHPRYYSPLREVAIFCLNWVLPDPSLPSPSPAHTEINTRLTRWLRQISATNASPEELPAADINRIHGVISQVYRMLWQPFMRQAVIALGQKPPDYDQPAAIAVWEDWIMEQTHWPKEVARMAIEIYRNRG
jgi:hypothetical protein